MDSFGEIIQMDRVAVGLSLQGLADKLNEDRSLGLDRKVTTSWLHHLENGRSKPLTTVLKKGIARALKQNEEKYLTSHESLPSRTSTFAKFFDDQLQRFEVGSTAICDFAVDDGRPEEMADLLLCLYSFLVATDGKLIAFERSSHIALPVFLMAIRTWPDIDDLNSGTVVSKILAPHAAGGFIDCPLPSPDLATLDWVTQSVEVYERTADEAVCGLLDTDPMTYLTVVSPNSSQGVPEKSVYYYLNQREYGLLRGNQAEMAYRRFIHYRKGGLFTKCEYARTFAHSYREAAEHYHLSFGAATKKIAQRKGAI